MEDWPGLGNVHHVPGQEHQREGGNEPDLKPDLAPRRADFPGGAEQVVDGEEQQHAGAVEKQPEDPERIHARIHGIGSLAARQPAPGAGPGQEQGVGHKEERGGQHVPGKADLPEGHRPEGLGHQVNGRHGQEPPDEVEQEDRRPDLPEPGAPVDHVHVAVNLVVEEAEGDDEGQGHQPMEGETAAIIALSNQGPMDLVVGPGEGEAKAQAEEHGVKGPEIVHRPVGLPAEVFVLNGQVVSPAKASMSLARNPFKPDGVRTVGSGGEDGPTPGRIGHRRLSVHPSS